MKYNSIVLLFALNLVSPCLIAQLPETDIFISEISIRGGSMGFSAPVNITGRKGYDNQPCFMPDGKSLLFVAVKDTTQSDVYQYDFKSKKISQVTFSKESEYSPALSPDGNHITVVRVDSDNGQRFYSLPVSKLTLAEKQPGTDSIGYYCHINPEKLAMFILGNAMTLQILDLRTSQRVLVGSDVGRCIRLSHDGNKIFFVIKQNENEWSVFDLDLATGIKTKVIATLPGSEDFALLPDGTFLMGNKGKLFRFNPSSDRAWVEIADFTAALGDFYRISISPKGDRIAMVAFTGNKP